MKKMLKLEILDLEYANGKYRKCGTDNVVIDPNVIVEIYPPKKLMLTDTNYGYSENKTIGEIEAASIYTTNVHGRGINGVNTHKFITKESYEKIIALFEII